MALGMGAGCFVTEHHDYDDTARAYGYLMLVVIALSCATFILGTLERFKSVQGSPHYHTDYIARQDLAPAAPRAEPPLLTHWSDWLCAGSPRTTAPSPCAGRLRTTAARTPSAPRSRWPCCTASRAPPSSSSPSTTSSASPRSASCPTGRPECQPAASHAEPHHAAKAGGMSCQH